MKFRLLAAALALALTSGAALAQTVPPFYPGSAPTVSTWNSYFANKQDLLGFTPVDADFLHSSTCTMVSGTCTSTFNKAFLNLSTCVASWTGTGTLAGVIKVTSNLTTVTVSSTTGTDTAQVNWLCYGF